MYTSAVFGEGKCVLFREVSLIRGVLYRGSTVHMCYSGYTSGDCNCTHSKDGV